MHLITHLDSWNMSESIGSRSYATRRTLPTFIKDLMLWSSVFWSADGPMYVMNMNETVGIMSISPTFLDSTQKCTCRHSPRTISCQLLRPRVLFPSILMSSRQPKWRPALRHLHSPDCPYILAAQCELFLQCLWTTEHTRLLPKVPSPVCLHCLLICHLQHEVPLIHLLNHQDHSSYHLVR